MSSSRNSKVGNEPSWKTSERQELLHELGAIAPSLAELYEGALRLLYGEVVPGWTRFVAHAVREIRNSLPWLIGGLKGPRKRTEYFNLVDTLYTRWEKNGFPTDGTVPRVEVGESMTVEIAGLPIRRKVAKSIANLIKEHGEGRVRVKYAASMLFTAGDENYRAMIQPLLDSWLSVTEWFQKRAHDSQLVDSEFEHAVLRSKFEDFERMLMALVRGFFSTIEELEVVLEEANKGGRPSLEHVQSVVGTLAKPQLIRFFFDHLENPWWVSPLREAGWFGNPPSLIRDEVSGLVTVPTWSPSTYLARIANQEEANDVVLDICLSLETDNSSIHESIIDAALAMNPEQSALIAQKIRGWLPDLYSHRLPLKAGKLVAHLARGGESAASLELASGLLFVLPDKNAPSGSESELMLNPKPGARFDVREYDDVLERCLPALREVEPRKSLDLFAELLENAIQYSRRRADGGPEDGSYIWRPRVEVPRPNSVNSVLDSLVTAVHECALESARRYPDTVAEVVEFLEQKPWRVFSRIALGLIRQFADAMPALVREKLVDASLFEIPGLAQEYFDLRRECFGMLKEEERAGVLKWIRAGPNLEAWKLARKEVWGEEPTDEDAETCARHWRLTHFSSIADHLKGEWNETYSKLVAEFGPVEEPAIKHQVKVSNRGFSSPKTIAELESLSSSEIYSFLSMWKPLGSEFEPTPAGLAQVLKQLDLAKVSDIASEANALMNLDPTYVRAVVECFRDSAAKGRSLDWQPVLVLCNCVVGVPREIAGRNANEAIQDSDWGWTRDSVLGLIEVGLTTGDVEIPASHRHAVWSVIETLMEDPDPCQDRDKQDGRRRDHASAAANCTRGKAVRTAIAFALWVHRNLNGITDGSEELAGFREACERRLDPEMESSPAVHSVFGAQFYSLFFADQRWTRSITKRVFPTDDELLIFRQAAWESYLLYCPVYEGIFELLEDEYANSVENVAAFETKSGTDDLGNALVEHLMMFAWQGKVQIENGILSTFFEEAPIRLKKHAIEYVGQSLRRTEGEVDSEILGRLSRLWDLRLDVARKSSIDEAQTEELSAFGYWFASDKFNEDWALAHLTESINLSCGLIAERDVVKRLARVEDSRLSRAVECLRKLVDADREGWEIRTWLSPARRLLERALLAEDKVARVSAKHLINQFGELGHIEFGELLADT